MGKKVIVKVNVTAIGRLGGAATAANRTQEERTDASAHAANARWEEYYRQNPEKLKAKLEREAKAAKRHGKRASRAKAASSSEATGK